MCRPGFVTNRPIDSDKVLFGAARGIPFPGDEFRAGGVPRAYHHAETLFVSVDFLWAGVCLALTSRGPSPPVGWNENRCGRYFWVAWRHFVPNTAHVRRPPRRPTKRSIKLGELKSSATLEGPFWKAPREIAIERGASVPKLVAFNKSRSPPIPISHPQFAFSCFSITSINSRRDLPSSSHSY
jgi:Ribbon-helix-helix domain